MIKIMKKKEISFEVDYKLDWGWCSVSIEQLEEDIKAMKELGVTDVETMLMWTMVVLF